MDPLTRSLATCPPDRNLWSRRRWLRAAAALAGCGSVAAFQGPAWSAVSYDHLSTEDYLGEVQVLAQVRDEEVFTEGPAVDRRGDVYFTNVPAEKILTWSPRTRMLSVFREKSNQSNGLLFDSLGRLWACEGGAGRVTRTDMASGRIEVVAEKFNGFPLAAPNDLCLDGAGRLFFTSRPGVEDPAQGNVNAVYRLDPDGRLNQVLAWPDVHMPNGIVTSPDNRRLYLIEAHPDADRHRNILCFDLAEDGSLHNRRVLIDFYPGRSGDGMCIDRAGNLYVAAGLHARRGTSETLDTRPGIHVVSPEGRLLAYRQTPEDTITNCTFGGPDLRTLYVTCGSLLLAIPTKISGKATYRPDR